MKILFVNATTKEDSKTLSLANELLRGLDGEVIEVKLTDLNLVPYDEQLVNKRMGLIKEKRFDDEMFNNARQFKEADYIVIAAPLWDLSFPSLLKLYIESLCVSGLMFAYTEHGPKGFVNAKELVYISTSGGPMVPLFGYEYIKAVANMLFGIPKTTFFYAEGLDVWGNDVKSILEKTKQEIQEYMNKREE